MFVTVVNAQFQVVVVIAIAFASHYWYAVTGSLMAGCGFAFLLIMGVYEMLMKDESLPQYDWWERPAFVMTLVLGLPLAYTAYSIFDHWYAAAVVICYIVICTAVSYISWRPVMR